jgi:hypothetical protein
MACTVASQCRAAVRCTCNARTVERTARSSQQRAANRRTETGIPRVAMVQGAIPEHELAAVYDPMVNLILQGSKSMTVGRPHAALRPGHVFRDVHRPARGGRRAAIGSGEPYLAVSLTLDPARARHAADRPAQTCRCGRAPEAASRWQPSRRIDGCLGAHAAAHRRGRTTSPRWRRPTSARFSTGCCRAHTAGCCATSRTPTPRSRASASPSSGYGATSPSRCASTRWPRKPR